MMGGGNGMGNMVMGHNSNGGSSLNGNVYISNTNVDNFADIRNTIANSQFGFLPSILKSFY